MVGRTEEAVLSGRIAEAGIAAEAEMGRRGGIGILKARRAVGVPRDMGLIGQGAGSTAAQQYKAQPCHGKKPR